MNNNPGLLITLFLSTSITAASANPLNHTSLTLAQSCTLKPQLLLLTGTDLPALIGTNTQHIAAFKWSGTELQAIPFQIDQRDAEKRYQLADVKPFPFDSNDELVLLQRDTGERIPLAQKKRDFDDLIEVELRANNSDARHWLYLKKNTAPVPPHPQAYVHYDQATDAVRSEHFNIAFSATTPFLIDTLNWRSNTSDAWSADVADIMKIRHSGKLFGFIQFERSAADYHSELTAVKQGPIRIIRRTENKVSMFWKLKSPRVLVDYVISTDGFIMDTIIDIPFPVGIFFSDLVTLTTMDWNSDKNLPELTLRSDSEQKDLVINGKMSAEKIAFNGLAENKFSFKNIFGHLDVTLSIPSEFPITAKLYLRDDLSMADAPEQDLGQFGNTGFITTGWEKIDTEVHHLKFEACLSPN